MYAYICPDCGAYLDPGETCDCKAEREAAEKERHEANIVFMELVEEEENGQLRIAV